MQIAGSSAIVVGGAGGLGEATVRRLHGAGAKVVVADLADDKGKALENELGVRYVPTDATSEEAAQQALADAQSQALAHDNGFIEPQHLLLALLNQEDGGTTSLPGMLQSLFG